MKRKLLLFCIVFLHLLKPVFAQKEYNMWYFGDHAGITFNTNPPSALTDGAMFSSEGCSGICDENGNLLFYTNGDTVWNKYHHYMKNGISPIPYDNENAVQGAIVLKKPGSDHLYYIFCPGSDNGLSTQYLRYWVIDMNLDSGRGEAVVINKECWFNPNEKVAVTKHSNGEDLWIGTIDGPTGDFNCIRTINGELNGGIYTTPIGAVNSGIGTCKFSPDGKVFFSHAGYSPVKGAVFYLYHFDNALGFLSDRVEVAIPNSPWCGLEFSHDSKYLYVAYPETFMNLSNKIIVQYDLSSWNENAIDQSRTIIYSELVRENFGGLQLGPDKKIYVFQAHQDSLSVIEYPYRKGDSCQYHKNAIPLNGRECQVGGPYYPNYWYNSLHIDLGSDRRLCEGDSALLNSKAPAGYHIKWSTGDTIPAIVVKQSGTYWVTVSNEKDSITDSVKVEVGKKFQVFLGNDTAFCGRFSYLLNAGKNAISYHWNTGDTTISILVDQPGMYAVAIKDSNSCPAGDTILIDQLVAPSILVQYDSVSCQYVTLDASPRQKEAHYEWSTGDTTLSIRIDQKGEYTLTISNLFCSISQTVVVKNISKLCDKMTYYIPNAFTPGNDGLNETFKVVGTNTDQVNMHIYNRWGAMIYQGAEWDGTQNGKSCQQDTYIYSITITGTDKGKAVTKQVSGNITLLR